MYFSRQKSAVSLLAFPQMGLHSSLDTEIFHVWHQQVPVIAANIFLFIWQHGSHCRDQQFPWIRASLDCSVIFLPLLSFTLNFYLI